MVDWKKTITDPQASSLQVFGGDIVNALTQYHNNVDLAAGDALGEVRIATKTTFNSGKMYLSDLGGDHTMQFSVPNYSENKTLQFPSTMAATDDLVLRTSVQTLTSKNIDGATNTFTNVGDAAIAAHTSSKISITTKGQLNSSITYTDQANTFGDFDQVFQNGRLDIRNPANTASYSFITSAITAARSLTIPLLTADDTMVTEASTQPLTNKTLNATNNTITDSTVTAGTIMASNGTKFVGRAKSSTGLQVLRTNSGATDIEWASLDSERVGKSTASGNNATTVFNIAHGVGTNPTYAFVNCSSLVNTFTYVTNSTNIVVTFTTAPPTGTNNIIIYWRVVA